MTLLKPLVALDAEIDGCEQQRSDSRSNMFVAAVLYHGQTSTPVRIRNMSRNGALVESAELPIEQSEVRLCRGSRVAIGHIAWNRDNRAGIRFAGVVDVAGWLPKGPQSRDQERVDAVVHAFRTGQIKDQEPGPGDSKATDTVQQLLDMRDALNAAAEELAGNAMIAACHSGALQSLDVTAQRIARLASDLTRPG